MAHRPKHRELRSENSKSRQDNSGCPQKLVLVSLAQNDSSMGGLPNHAASSRIRTPELQTPSLVIAFCSFEEMDPEEDRLHAAIKDAGDFIWHRSEFVSGPEGPIPSAIEVTRPDPDAVIVALRVADMMFVEQLFARLRQNNQRLPILVAPCGLTTDQISQVLALGAADFFFTALQCGKCRTSIAATRAPAAWQGVTDGRN